MKIKTHLSVAAAFAAFTMTSAEKAPGDIIQLKLVVSKTVDQLRILTKPRAGYNPANDAPSVWDMRGNTCKDVSSVDFIFAPIDDESKCCKLPSLDGFNLWPEKQGYTIPANSKIIAQEHFPLDNGCFERKGGKTDSYTLQAGETLNSYMVQALALDQSMTYLDNIVEFHK